jgi:alkanesulfonate monooxygenase SsuD/methylene tetrahydromethanopterin reductase-like flavin-dependent oxidoreductase (luciferase family)
LTPSRRRIVLDPPSAALRKLWAGEEVTVAGEFVRLDGVSIHPAPTRRLPLWLGDGAIGNGGRPATRALERAARLADGFKMMAPLGADVARARSIADDLRERVARHGRDPAAFGLEARILVQATTPEQWREQLALWADHGATHIGLTNRILGGGVPEQLALLQQFAEVTGGGD